MMRRLPAGDLEVLAFEREEWRHQGNKDTAIVERFHISPTSYYQRLNWLISTPAAEQYDPELVRRLRRIRDQRRALRRGPAGRVS